MSELDQGLQAEQGQGKKGNLIKGVAGVAKKKMDVKGYGYRNLYTFLGHVYKFLSVRSILSGKKKYEKAKETLDNKDTSRENNQVGLYGNVTSGMAAYYLHFIYIKILIIGT